MLTQPLPATPEARINPLQHTPERTFCLEPRGRHRQTGSHTRLRGLLCLALAGLNLGQLQAGALPPVVRGWELVTLTSKEIPELAGSPGAALRAFSWHRAVEGRPAGWKAELLQVDDVDADGRYVLPSGPRAQPGDGVFSGPDELVLLARSLGDAPPADAKAPCDGSLLPLTIGRRGEAVAGYITLGRCRTGTPEASGDLTHYDRAGREVVTEDYRIGFDALQVMEPVRLSYQPGMGGTGQNILRALFVEGRARMLGGLLQLRRGLDHMISEELAWKDGPIRVIRRTSPRIHTYGSHYTNPGTFTLDSIHQPGLLAFELQMSSSIDLKNLVSDLLLTVAWDFRAFSGMQLYFSSPIPAVTLDGRASEEEQRLGEKDAQWMFASGAEGSFAGRLMFKPGLPLEKHLYYVDESGGSMRAGYRLSGLHRIGKGLSWYRAEFWNLARADYGACAGMLQERQKPLTRQK